jgi:hypothetical protein
MARVRINLNIDEELNRRWTEVCKKHSIPKSRMLDELLREILPAFEETDLSLVLSRALNKTADAISHIESLTDKSKKSS